ncbi:MAG TPA: TrmH family RNA methyltransferase [Chloroflexota bacterium]|nr:TrmH family RNA methyltransferase [Chloroflexota bacterium]
MDVSVILENVRSLYNVGAVMRVCDGAGVARVIACGITPYPPQSVSDPRRGPVIARAERELRKTALAAYESVRVEFAPGVAEAAARVAGAAVIAVERMPQAADLWQAPYLDRRPLALLFGHETDGLSPEALALADATISIPMYGAGKSLNVATAVAVVLYEVVRRQSTSA